jgi:hypothetical protein
MIKDVIIDDSGGTMMTEDRHFTHSTLRELIVEHVFVGDVLRTLWHRGVTATLRSCTLNSMHTVTTW